MALWIEGEHFAAGVALLEAGALGFATAALFALNLAHSARRIVDEEADLSLTQAALVGCYVGLISLALFSFITFTSPVFP